MTKKWTKPPRGDLPKRNLKFKELEYLTKNLNNELGPEWRKLKKTKEPYKNELKIRNTFECTRTELHLDIENTL